MSLFFIILKTLFVLIISKNDNDILEEKNKQYLEFSFNRNLTLSNSMSPEEIFKSIFYNQIYIKIKLGSEQVEIPFYLYLQQYSFIIQSSEVSKDQVKGLYNNLKSKTYVSSSKPEFFIVLDMSEGILSEDNFYFNNGKDQSFLTFYLCNKNNDESHITEGGKIGFKFEPESSQSEEAFFITNLKEKNLISELIFSFKYDSDEEGKLFIGTYPHNIDNNRFNNKYFLNDNTAQIFSKIEWAFFFDEIKIGNNIIETKSNSFLYIEIGYIIGSKKYFDYLLSLDTWKEYFKGNKKCHETKFVINDFEKNDVSQKLSDDYTIYYCDKEVDVSKINIGELSFVDKMMNYEFSFNKEDLWEEKNGYKYFKIISHEYYNEYWFLGKPFFQKYQLVFDYDNKKIGLYSKILNDFEIQNNDNGKKNIFIYIFIIIGLIIIIAGLIYLLFKAYKNFPKKKIANELLDDNYVYPVNEMIHVN